jgi:serine/threonine protein kinase
MGRVVTKLPGYTLGRRLGGGPTSDVVLATDGRGVTVAAKVLKAESEDDPFAVALFRREAEAGRLVRHPHLVRVLDAHVDSPPYVLTMAFVGGKPAKSRLLAEGPQPLTLALGIARQMAEALAALHGHGLIHGDVKTANVLLPAPGKAVLIDLGFAHRPGDLKPWSDRGHVVGTANYLAPELAVLPPTDTTAADVFSLGVSLYELLTGTLPYPGRSTAEVVKHRRDCDAANLPMSFSRDVRMVVTKMTDPDPTRRPTAKALVGELAGLQIATLGRRAA